MWLTNVSKRLQFKLLTPLLAAGFIFVLAAQFYWLPMRQAQVRDGFQNAQRNLIGMIKPALVGMLLSGDTAELYALLEQVSRSTPQWKRVQLIGPSGQRLFPLAELPPQTGVMIDFDEVLRYNNSSLGRLLVGADPSEVLHEEATRTYLISGVLLLLLFVVSGGVVAWQQNRRVLQPLQHLANAAKRLAANDFTARLPRAEHDEVGDLIRAFDSMRTNILAAQREASALAETVNLHAIVSTTCRDGKIADVNDAFCMVSGYSREELLSQDHRVLDSGYQDKDFWNAFWLTISEGRPWRGEICNRSKSGQLYWVDCMIAPFMGADGLVEKYVDIAIDITERKMSTNKLRLQEEYLRNILNNIGDPVFVKDEHSRFVLVNEAFCDFFGVPKNEIVGKTMVGNLFAERQETLLNVDGQLLGDGQERLIDDVIPWPGGSPRITQTRKNRFVDESGCKFIIGVIRDITASKQMESQLRETQNLEAIGQLTGGLAHDFNNLLGIVVGNLDMMQEQLKGADPRLRRQLDTARDAVLRGSEVTRSLLAVARRQPLEVQSLDINTLLLEMLPLVRASGGSMVTLTAHLEPQLLMARIDSGGLSNAVLNLAINARDAMQATEGEHRLNLHTRRARMAPGNNLNLAPGDYAVVEVSDNGPGMTDAVRAQVFEPFFTTKGVGKGTGLGLAMVLGYTEQFGGTARIDSTVGQGTTVSLYLPLDAAAQEQADATEAARLGALQGLHVLDTPPEDEYDALVAEAARICGTPIALVSLVDENRQWFKSRVGLQAEETGRVDAFCAHVVLKPNQTMVVPDARRELRFSDNPLVTGPPDIRFYAGVPLQDANGYALGTLCVIDRVPRRLDDSQIEQLEALAARVGELLRERALQEAQASGFGDLKADTPDAPGALRVLVVDDEEGLCELACAWLGALGYDTVSVLSPKEALVQLAASHFDVLFTDVVMPGDVDGVTLAREALVRQPGLRVLLTSGYARDLLENGNAPGPLLNKPYRKKDLAGAFTALYKETV